MMGDNPSCPPMPDGPRLRLLPAEVRPDPPHPPAAEPRVARENGLDEKVIMACLLHDIAIAGLVSANHGYWARNWSRPYVDEGGRLGHREARGAALLPDEGGGVQYPRRTSTTSARTTARLPYYSGRRRRPAAPVVHDVAGGDDHDIYSFRPERDRGVRRVLRHRGAELQAAHEGLASTGRRWRTCGGR